MLSKSVKKDMFRRKMVARYELKRLLLKSLIYESGVTPLLRNRSQLILDAMPKNSCASRLHNFCFITGRSNAVFRRFRATRMLIKRLAASGKLPGVTKTSW